MKMYLRLFLAIISLSSCILYRSGKRGVAKIVSPTATMLDTLQGNWANNNDSLDSITISGRYWNHHHNEPTYFVNDTAVMYFSDTMVSYTDFRYATIDTTALSGHYIVFVDINDSLMSCYEFNGFYVDSTGTYFGMNPINRMSIKSTLGFHKK